MALLFSDFVVREGSVAFVIWFTLVLPAFATPDKAAAAMNAPVEPRIKLRVMVESFINIIYPKALHVASVVLPVEMKAFV